MIDLEKLDTELERFTLEDCLYNSQRLDIFFKLMSIKQALVQIKQVEAQTSMLESMVNMQNNIDSDALNEFMKNNSIQDLMKKFSQ